MHSRHGSGGSPAALHAPRRAGCARRRPGTCDRGARREEARRPCRDAKPGGRVRGARDAVSAARLAADENARGRARRHATSARGPRRATTLSSDPAASGVEVDLAARHLFRPQGMEVLRAVAPEGRNPSRAPAQPSLRGVGLFVPCRCGPCRSFDGRHDYPPGFARYCLYSRRLWLPNFDRVTAFLRWKAGGPICGAFGQTSRQAQAPPRPWARIVAEAKQSKTFDTGSA